MGQFIHLSIRYASSFLAVLTRFLSLRGQYWLLLVQNWRIQCPMLNSLKVIASYQQTDRMFGIQNVLSDCALSSLHANSNLLCVPYHVVSTTGPKPPPPPPLPKPGNSAVGSWILTIFVFWGHHQSLIFVHLLMREQVRFKQQPTILFSAILLVARLSIIKILCLPFLRRLWRKLCEWLCREIWVEELERELERDCWSQTPRSMSLRMLQRTRRVHSQMRT